MVLRVVLGQPGPRAPLGADEVVVSSELVRIEVMRTLDRLRVSGALSDGEHLARSTSALALLATMHLFPLADEVVDASCEKYAIEVSSLCAIHVATALQVSREVDGLQVWTHHPPQAIAALTRGLDVRGRAIRV